MNDKIFPLFVVCIALVAAAGCVGFPTAGFDPSSALQDIGKGGLQSESRMAYAGDAASSPLTTSVPTPSGSGIAGIETKIIRTAFLTVEVKDVPGSVELLKNLSSRKGGYVSSTNIQKNYNNRLSGSVILRIPAAEFENTLTGVRTIGTSNRFQPRGRT